MKANKIHHIGIVIADLETGKRLFGDLFGMEFDHEESSEVWNVKAAFYRCGESMIELLQPIGPGVDQDFLERTGGGIHHICYQVDDIEDAYRTMSQHVGVDGGSQSGNGGSRIFFLKPEDVFNIETEFLEPKRESGL